MTSTESARCVLICVDCSEHSERAFKFYIDHLSRPGDHVTLLQVLEAQQYLIPLDGAFVTPMTNKMLEEELKKATEDAKATGHALRERLSAISVESKYVLRVGPEAPGPYIVATAEKKEAKLVVMGSRGQGMLRRTFLGSVSDYVLHHSHMPVCVVPPPQHA